MRRALRAARVGSVRARYAGAGSLTKGTRRTRGREIRQRRRAGGSRDIFCETPAAGLGHGAGCFWVGASPRPPSRGGRGGSVTTASFMNTARGRRRGPSRAPGPAPVVACVEASYGPLRGAVVRARDVSLETETSSKTQSRWRSVPSAGRRSRVPRRRLRRRGEPFGTSALARRGRSAVRGRVGQSPSIHLEPARCRRDARDPILIAEAQRALLRRHAPPKRRRARRLAHGVAGHDLARFPLAAAVAAAARSKLR